MVVTKLDRTFSHFISYSLYYKYITDYIKSQIYNSKNLACSCVNICRLCGGSYGTPDPSSIDSLTLSRFGNEDKTK